MGGAPLLLNLGFHVYKSSTATTHLLLADLFPPHLSLGLCFPLGPREEDATGMCLCTPPHILIHDCHNHGFLKRHICRVYLYTNAYLIALS